MTNNRNGLIGKRLIKLARFMSLVIAAWHCPSAFPQNLKDNPKAAEILQINKQLDALELKAILRQKAGAVDLDADEDLQENGIMWGEGAFQNMNRQQLQESLFGALGGSESDFQKLKRESIRREIDRINVICNLTDEQMQKLTEAIEFDIEHLHAKIQKAMSLIDPKMTIQQFQQIRLDVQKIGGIEASNVNQAGEIWGKVLRSMMTLEQKKKIEEDQGKVNANKVRTQQFKTLLSLQRKLGLTAVQRAAISTWLEQENKASLDFVAICKSMAKTNDQELHLTANQRAILSQQIAVENNAIPAFRLIPAVRVGNPK